jgi:hypothetical protein
LAPTVSYIQGIAQGGQHKFTIARKVQGMRHSAKNILSSIFGFPISLIAFHFEVTAQKYDHHFVIQGIMLPSFPFVHEPGLKIEVFPLGRFGGDTMI